MDEEDGSCYIVLSLHHGFTHDVGSFHTVDLATDRAAIMNSAGFTTAVLRVCMADGRTDIEELSYGEVGYDEDDE